MSSMKNIEFAKASVKTLKISPLKLNIVARAIQGMLVGEAINMLTFSKKRISREVKKILNSAISNAENNNSMDIDKLMVHEVNVGKAMVMKRMRPRAKGRGVRILKPFSNMTIILKEKGE